MTDTTPFWTKKALCDMTRREWESLCDRCGHCCLEKLQDAETGDIALTSVACAFLDTNTCRCMIYDVRGHLNPQCVELTPGNVGQLQWLPAHCAYRLIDKGQDLPWWHPLVSGDPDTVHRAGMSIRGKALSGRYVHPLENVPGI
jgi:uncharacterized cysteine cluster protein YcgN (CxxCxxCC family)